MARMLTAVFGGVAVLLGLLGLFVNPVALGVAVPFAIATGILYYHASGRLRRDVRQRAGARRQRTRDRRRGPRDRRRSTGGTDASTDHDLSATEAYEVLGLDPGADEAAVRAAYRDRVKEVHPDRGGDEASFRRVKAAYSRLVDDDGERAGRFP
ncbi:MAG: J domain-containing protein [Halobacteriaceae archaeon]